MGLGTIDVQTTHIPDAMIRIKMKQNQNLVVTGYVVSNSKGAATALQRNGSNYSASIMGRLL